MKTYYIHIVLLVCLLSCCKELSDEVFFTPTDHVVGALGNTMRLTVLIPGEEFYSFSSDSSRLNCEGSKCYDVLVLKTEMNLLATNLSDTIIFKWSDMTSDSPYPQDNCILLIYDVSNYMCSIGSNGSSTKIISELSKSTSGKTKEAFDEIFSKLSDL